MVTIRRRLLRRHPDGGTSLSADTAVLSTAQIGKLLVQALYLVLLARGLGSTSFGEFVSIVALAAVASPFAGLGAANVFVREVRAAQRDPRVSWGNGLVTVGASSSLLSAAIVGTCAVTHFKAPLYAVGLVCVADLIFMRVTEVGVFGFLAVGRTADVGIQTLLVTVARLGSLCILIALHEVSLWTWCAAYLGASIAATAFCMYRATRAWGPPRVDAAAWRATLRDSISFSISNGAATFYNDIDKIMLASLSGFTATGIYGAAYRAIDAATMPIRSLAAAAYPRFFEIGTRGIGETYEYARGIIRRVLPFTVVLSVVLFVGAPLLADALGSQFHDVAPALRWLCVIPILRTIHFLFADALAGANLMHARICAQVVAVVANVILNIILMPRYSWLGAAWASVAIDAFLVAAFWMTIHAIIARQAVLVGLAER